jgi:Holliday junction resolvase RusA-like endonuclease
MAMHVEFVVFGPPISNQQSKPQGKQNLAAWQATVRGALQKLWATSPLTGELKAIIINFYDGNRPTLDVYNMSKPILDAMQGIVYSDDRQVRQAELTHLRIDAAFSIAGVSKVLVNALQAGTQFVYIRLEDPVDPFPLPR